MAKTPEEIQNLINVIMDWGCSCDAMAGMSCGHGQIEKRILEFLAEPSTPAVAPSPAEERKLPVSGPVSDTSIYHGPFKPVVEQPEPSPESLAEIPEVKDWSGAVRGKFCRPKPQPANMGSPAKTEVPVSEPSISKRSNTMEHTAVQDKLNPYDWRVEAFGSDGECFVTIFSGPDAETRSKEYATWKTN